MGWKTLAAALLAVLAAGPAAAVPPYPNGPESAGRVDLASAHAQGLDRPAGRGARLPHKLLVLLVDFADVPHSVLSTTSRFDSLFFAPAGSARAFYAASSFGRYVPQGTVSAWLRLPQTHAFYADAERRGAGVRGAYPRNARRMVEDAVRAADASIDFAAFDDDGPDGVPASGDDDGIVDALVVVHAGTGAEFGASTDILSHTWFTNTEVATADGVAAWLYATVAEDSPLGVRVHEIGHLLGLPDLYDRRSTPPFASGLGDWSLMASGAWLDGGRTPADLDGASKIELGFVDALEPRTNSFGLGLRAAATGSADVYRIWSHGTPEREFFVVENRQRQGLDTHLPGSGLLVYHVDLDQAHNDDPDRPRVRVLQADGQEHLERRINNGDAGDPFPGTRGTIRLGFDTQPSSRRHDGGDSQVDIADISAPTARMTFDLQVESQPRLELAAHAVQEIAGDGDGIAEAGETIALEIELRNAGLDAAPFEIAWRAEPDSEATWILDRVAVPGLPKDARVPIRLELTSAAGLYEPHALRLHATFVPPTFGPGFVLEIGLGQDAGFQACLGPGPSRFTRDCSDPRLPWTSRALRGDDAWQFEFRPGEFGGVYRSARFETTSDDVDLGLESPPFQLAARSELRLLHAFDVEALAAGWAHDGGRVEIALDGGAWEAIEPRGGYPYRLWFESVPHLAMAGVFSGRSTRRWDVFDLGDRSGSARLRFRFVSSPQGGGAGWEIARVEVNTDAAAAAGPRLALAVEPNPVRLPARIAFRIIAPLTIGARSTSLRIYDARGRLVRTLTHAPVPAESAFFEWDGTDRAGRRLASGLYVARLDWGGEHATAKLLVVR